MGSERWPRAFWEGAAVRDSEIQPFLWFGYVPAPGAFPISVSPRGPCAAETAEAPLSRLAAEAAGLWRQAIEACLATCRGAIVVPLSGGLDSRAILAGLLDHVSAAQIATYTFGVPGAYDYEIGRRVAAAVGTRHRAFDLNQYSYSFERLSDISRRVAGRTALFQHAPVSLIEQEYGAGATQWIGFMGDPLSGSHLPAETGATWEQAKQHFVQSNRFAGSTRLTPASFDPAHDLPAEPLVDPRLLCYEEQLDFAVRQTCYTKPLVLLDGGEYVTPFLQPPWVDFSLRVPPCYRRAQYLYKEMLQSTYPRLFSLPTKNNGGLPLQASRWRRQVRRLASYARTLAGHVHPGLNYIDFEEGLRRRSDLRTVVCESLQDLKKRGPVDWIDMEGLWRQHQRRQRNHADALTLLASLEINLKTQDKATT